MTVVEPKVSAITINLNKLNFLLKGELNEIFMLN